ncbi:MAG: hypothetical protein U0795_09935 [Pirellulales bacterium]
MVSCSWRRRDASLFDLPAPPWPGRRGRPRIYGKNKLSLVKRAGQRHGWESITYHRRGVEVTHQYKTFLATDTRYHPCRDFEV